MKRFLAAALFFAVTSSNAAYIDGNDLYGQCQKPDNSPERVFCLGYIAGSIDMGRGAAFCPPPNVTIGQATDIVMKALREVPEARSLAADIFIIEVSKRLWPCAEKKPQPGARGI